MNIIFTKNKILRRLVDITNRLALRFLLKDKIVNKAHTFKKIGSPYGGWIVPVDLIKKNWICYCGGVGEDITFDLGLINIFSCNVYAFDPTPRAKLHVEKEAKNIEKYKYYNVGLWSSKMTLKFYEPRNQEHVSHSVVNLQGTKNYFEATCKRVSEIMDDLNHQTVDLIKIDIEGAEYEVLSSIIQDDLKVKVLCTEFDQPTPFWKTYYMVRRLIEYGYELVVVDGWNYTFIYAESGALR